MDLGLVKSLFEASGGRFFSSPEVLKDKLTNIKALLLDWDGVFNSGIKGQNVASPFSEVDSMGLNMLRFSFFKVQGAIPFTGIVTGENNPSAFFLAERENFHAVFYSLKRKAEIFDFLYKNLRITPDQIAYVFDDLVDIPVAKEAGLRFYIPRTCNPMLTHYMFEHGLSDYSPGNKGGEGAVREVSELMIALHGHYSEVIEERIGWLPAYQNYQTNKKALNAAFYTSDSEEVRVEGIAKFSLIQ